MVVLGGVAVSYERGPLCHPPRRRGLRRDKERSLAHSKETGILLPNNQRQHRTSHATKDAKRAALLHASGNEGGYGYSVAPYGIAYRSALRTSRIRRTTRLSDLFLL